MTRDVYMTCVQKKHISITVPLFKKGEVNLMTVARKYLLNNGNTADYFTKGSQPRPLAKLKWCLGLAIHK